MQKTRPAVIVNDDLAVLPLKVIDAVTDWKEHYAQAPWTLDGPPGAWICNRIFNLRCHG
jgi:mRNA interferase MazF